MGHSSTKPSDRKAEYRPLRVDEQGREIDEFGNVVKREIAPVKTLAANLAASGAAKKKENPYLAHRSTSSSSSAPVPAVASNAPVAVASSSSSAMQVDNNNAGPETAAAAGEAILDERLPTKKREMKGKKALQFVEAGKYIKEAAKLQEKEERKIIAGYASGRKQIERVRVDSI